EGDLGDGAGELARGGELPHEHRVLDPRPARRGGADLLHHRRAAGHDEQRDPWRGGQLLRVHHHRARDDQLRRAGAQLAPGRSGRRGEQWHARHPAQRAGVAGHRLRRADCVRLSLDVRARADHRRGRRGARRARRARQRAGGAADPAPDRARVRAVRDDERRDGGGVPHAEPAEHRRAPRLDAPRRRLLPDARDPVVDPTARRLGAARVRPEGAAPRAPRRRAPHRGGVGDSEAAPVHRRAHRGRDVAPALVVPLRAAGRHVEPVL
ncbi:MAG: hypothetical protein AVDCRST_MAG11-4162, partial [uncultured Gemmatimonadaceae bacterium]